MSRKNKTKNNSPLPKRESFEDKQLRTIEILTDRIGEELLKKTGEELYEPKVQSLQRIYTQNLRVHKTLNDSRNKNRPQRDDFSGLIKSHWQGDVVAFAREALEVELFDHQKEVCLSEKRINVLIAGRGAGKSVAARVKALHQACCFDNHTVLIVSSGQRMSSDFGEKILELLRESPIHKLVSSVSQEKVRFKNGSSISFLPANPETIRGYHPKAAKGRKGITVILDEACFMENGFEIRKAVEYALITVPGTNGRLYIVSSPSATGSWVHDYVKKAKNDRDNYQIVQCGSAANPNVSPEEIERLRASKNELEFRAEVLGEWVDGAYTLFGGLIEPNRVDSATPQPAEAIYALGADLALSFNQTHDRNAIAVVARQYPPLDNPGAESRFRLVEMAVLDHASDRELRQTVKRLVEKYDVSMAAIENYQGKGLAEYAQSLDVETQLVAPTPGLQQMAFHELHRLLRQGLLDLPNDLPEVFFQELNAFEYRRSDSGQIAFGHPESAGQHDDTVYALAWAIHAAQADPPPPRQITPKPQIHFLPQT